MPSGMVELMQESVMTTGVERGVPAEHSMHLIRLATQVRALGHAGKRVVLFAPVGEAPRSEDLVQKIADSLSLLDRCAVMVINLKTGSRVRTVPASLGRSALGRAESSLTLGGYAESSPAMTAAEDATKLVSRSNSGDGPLYDLPSLLESVRPQVGYVLIDAPELTANASTSLAAAYAEAVVLLVQRDSAKREQILATRQQFSELGVVIAGFVFLS